MVRILLVDDSPEDRIQAAHELNRALSDLQIEEVGNADHLARAIEAGRFDLVITDYRLRWSDGLEVLHLVKSRYPLCPVVMFTDSGSEEVAVEGMKAGLSDYVLKGRKLYRLPIAVQESLEKARLRREAEQERQRFALLVEASRLFASSLDYRTTLAQVAQMVVPRIADWCFIDLLQPDSTILSEPIVVAVDLAKAALVTELRRRYPTALSADYGPPKVMRTGEPELVTEISEELVAKIAQDETHLNILRQLQARSYMIVPLKARDRIFGTLSLASARRDRQYQQTDLALVIELAHRAAIAIDNARLYEEARNANRLKDEFLAIVSHELRTPLNAILGWASLLDNPRASAATRARAIEIIQRNARRQEKLIADILDISRIISSQIQLNLEPVHLIPIIEAAVEDIRPGVDAKHLQIQLDLDPTVRPVLGDSQRLQQIVWNLLSNAVKFTPSGGRVEVRLEEVRGDGGDGGEEAWMTLPSLSSSQLYAQITVTDTGKGIQADFLDHIFEHFRQADSSSTRSQGGLGLGLAIVKNLVELHNGTIQATSEGEGQGATFTVQIPALIAPYSSMQDQNESDSNFPDLKGLRVLVVDDDDDTRELMALVLEQCQAEVKTAALVREALTIFTSFQPDLLISDLSMPDEDGYSLIRQVRELEADQGGSLPAIALSAFADDENQQRALASGFQSYLTKPIDPFELVIAVANTADRAV